MSTDHFSGHAAAYARHRPGYPVELFSWLATTVQARELVWDCATGNGQAALALAEHFECIVATDLSAEQIAQATPHPRIDYRVATAEASGLPDASCDLVTVAQALHWFDHARFNAEVRRVLRPGGVIAAWTYTLLQAQIDPAAQAAIADFNRHVVGPYWPPERRWVDTGYQGIDFPFEEIAAPPFAIHLEWTLDDLIAYLRTWSSTQRYIKALGVDPTPTLRARLAQHWPDPASKRSVIWPLALRVGRV
jgi:ubiquinone/menaquinone biosynthesis C-methylase UbiE